MNQFFDELHASWRTELYGLSCGLADSPAIQEAKRAANFAELGKAYAKQLRYREAAIAFSLELDDWGEDLSILRQRAGKYLATLQTTLARRDFLRCGELGADELDISYRLGLCDFYDGSCEKAMGYFADVLPIADDEMGIAIIYWHTICAWRSGAAPELLNQYHAGMKVGHHTGYERAVRLWAGKESLTDSLLNLCGEGEDLEFSITAYGVAQYLLHTGMAEQGDDLLRAIRKRDSFWVSFAYLAAWKDQFGGSQCTH